MLRYDYKRQMHQRVDYLVCILELLTRPYAWDPEKGTFMYMVDVNRNFSHMVR